MGAEDVRDARAGGAELLHDHRGVHGEATGATRLGGDQEAQHALFGSGADEIPVEVARILTGAAVDLKRSRAQLSLRKASGPRAQLLEPARERAVVSESHQVAMAVREAREAFLQRALRLRHRRGPA